MYCTTHSFYCRQKHKKLHLAVGAKLVQNGAVVNHSVNHSVDAKLIRECIVLPTVLFEITGHKSFDFLQLLLCGRLFALCLVPSIHSLFFLVRQPITVWYLGVLGAIRSVVDPSEPY